MDRPVLLERCPVCGHSRATRSGPGPCSSKCAERQLAAPITIIIEPKCEHDWTGPDVKFENGASVSCAKCGMLAIDHDAQS